MSDPKSTVGEPVEDSTAVDDVVGSVNEGLADAEAAGRDAVGETDEPVADAPAEVPADAPAGVPAESDAAPVAATAEEPVTEEPVVQTVPEEPVAAEPAEAEIDYAAYQEPADEEPAYDAAAAGAVAASAYAVGEPEYATAEPVVAPSEPAIAAAALAPQPIFVQAPEPPRARGNRAAAGAIGLLAALAFALLYLGSWLGIGLVTGDITTDDAASSVESALASWVFWLPVVLFFLGFWLLGAIINRGRWGHWVIFGLFVGIISWAGYVLGLLCQAPFWMLTPTEGVDLVRENTFAPLAIAAFIIGRELTIWFGSWAAARGKRVTELNIEAMREYERTLEAGPQIYRQ